MLRRSLILFITLFVVDVQAQSVDIYRRPHQPERSRSYDALHYRVHLIFDEAAKSFRGTNTITLRPLGDRFQEVHLDAETFTVDGVTDMSGRTLQFVQHPHRLEVTLHRPYAYGDTVTFTVKYHADQVDIDSEAYGMSATYDLGIDFKDPTDNNPQLINTLSFPQGARHWMPCYDHPNDRATNETLLTVRPEYKALSNGKLVSVTTEMDGMVTWHWLQELPHPTYLYVAVAGPYVVLEDSLGSLPVNYWVYPKDVDDAMRSFHRTPEIITFLTDLYGVEYPWIKYDQITIPGIGGGAESTTATVLGQSTIHDEDAEQDYPSDWLVAHEAAHQWWGNMISYRDWSQTWLSESFATWSEYVWAVYAHGEEEGAVNLLGKKDAYFREARNRYRRPVVFERWQYPNENFDRHTYQKGAVIIEMLRRIMGLENFQRAMRHFLTKHAFQPVHTHDLMTAIKESTGQNMDWFFEQWIYNAGHPVIKISKGWTETGELELIVEQVQDMVASEVYRMPVMLKFVTASGTQEETIWLDERTETFTFALDDTLRMIRFDADDAILAEWTFEKTVSERLTQLELDDAMGRHHAARALGESISKDERTGIALMHCATHDLFWHVRMTCIEELGEARNPDYASLFVEGSKDAHSRVRTAAISALGDLESDLHMDFLMDRFMEDSSYRARAEVLRSLGKMGSVRVRPFLEEALSIGSPRNVIRTAAEWALEQLSE